jgi:hypothetical protein
VAGEYLDDVVERVPLVDHEGKSGALLERVRLGDGRHLIVKRFSPKTDLLMAALGDVSVVSTSSGRGGSWTGCPQRSVTRLLMGGSTATRQ